MEKAKILLVDDRPENLLALEGLLRSDDRILFKARSGLEALELLIQHEFALALLDVQMPEMNGLELAELMRSSGDTQTIPIIFVTAGGRDPSVAFRGFDAGAVDFLYKPLNEQITRSKVDVFIELDRQKRRLQQELRNQEAARAELERSRGLLAASNRELERFAYVASHDLKEPLRMISTTLSLLARKYKDRLDGEADELIQTAVGGAKRMTGLIHSLIQLSKAGHGELVVSSIDTGGLVSEVLQDLGTVIAETNALVKVSPLPTIEGDRAQFHQLFQNLISNGIKFSSGKRPTITIEAERADVEWRFTVRDNGIGIAASQLNRIFDPFVRGAGAGEYTGDGIGLSICKTIVEKHGGRIWAHSEEGNGSCFSFTVPIAGSARGGVALDPA